MSVQRIATRYAKSLIELAEERGKLDRVLEDVQSFSQVASNRDFYLLLKSPIVKADKKEKIFKALFEGKYDKLTLAFLHILLKKGREEYLADVAKEFIVQYKAIKHISTVKVTTAAKLSDAALEAIRKKLVASSVTDEKVEINTAIDPALIGGFVIEFNNRLYDSSVTHKLELLKKEFKDNHYISQIIAH
jgi:F-type H+-transporting ATPase subunit delta